MPKSQRSVANPNTNCETSRVPLWCLMSHSLCGSVPRKRQLVSAICAFSLIPQSSQAPCGLTIVESWNMDQLLNHLHHKRPLQAFIWKYCTTLFVNLLSVFDLLHLRQKKGQFTVFWHYLFKNCFFKNKSKDKGQTSMTPPALSRRRMRSNSWIMLYLLLQINGSLLLVLYLWVCAKMSRTSDWWMKLVP